MDMCSELLHSSLQQGELSTRGTFRVEAWTLRQVAVRPAYQSYFLKSTLQLFVNIFIFASRYILGTFLFSDDCRYYNTLIWLRHIRS